MKHLASLPYLAASLVWLATMIPAVRAAQSASQSSEPIPVSELGAKAGAQYQGDGLSVAATPEGARLRCVFQITRVAPSTSGRAKNQCPMCSLQPERCMADERV